jgi:hypothetical protein
MRIAGEKGGARPIVLGLVALLVFSGYSEEDDNPFVLAMKPISRIRPFLFPTLPTS